MARKEPEPVRITTASRSHSDDISTRQRRYLISMGIRTACFIAAVLSIGHWYLWVFLVASFVLPYVAVVMANAGSSPDPDGGPDLVRPDPERRALVGPRDGGTAGSEGTQKSS
ncbi:MAG: DUF3099 domain-containing protein [Nocardioidaceae bacterium]|nr:DUF3099 domain-containing protein [Nocardioidaceae bacterium]